MKNNLERLRKQIDSLDAKLVDLINQRAKISQQIGKFKAQKKYPVYSPERESKIIRRLRHLNKGPINSNSLEAIYREIMSSSLSLEKSMRISYLGPEATFTHLASLKKFGSSVKYLPAHTISDVFINVEQDLADYGVVPVENSIEGAINHTLDMLVDSSLSICAQIKLSVSHNLLSRYKLPQIKKIYSNPQVFGQCRFWLRANLPHAELIEVSSTSRAAEIAAKEKNSACIASRLAGEVYKLALVAASIEDTKHNITRFLVVGKNESGATGKDKTSIAFSIKDKVGALQEMLAPFKKYKINLTKIESRPSKRKAWDYYFFIDLEGHMRDKNVKSAVDALSRQATYLRVLGSYPSID
ncbi:MAG: prephenate dehydratase [Candidatus Omnitrophica bacterium CG11_big_fil_rev_8_21_14_0_20_42_13]|uniref:Bifunctional chorismate mutase/prephenate dehydratase n=1 Tax=Candidatus Ghiorseimicrobium undicola TaxID=1974746 RepID=A0A2H0M1Q5_9BACT|nr:MAG: prephenate dehydratase [Candidatus Omnitrophica bacterium CG11_big_fil_rev_8_21_14_0_20_42_13]